MKQRLRPRLTYGNVMATIALFVALGGAAMAAGLPKGSVGPRQLKRGAVHSFAIARHAVTAGKLAPKSVQAGKLGPNAVLPGNLGNGIISTAKIAGGAVIAESIRNGSITTKKLQQGAVVTSKLAEGAVTTGKVANGAIIAGKLADGSVTPAKLSPDVSPLLGTLRSGQTLRGVFDLGSSSTTIGELAREAESFQFPLLGAPTAAVLKKGETSTGCPGLGGGSEQTPLASPGALCVYITEGKGLDSTQPLAVENDTRLGFGLAAKGDGSGEFFAYGQWAVTAP